ncbi:MAG: OmpH family outer membrane protein [Bacteroidaceae bacterium]|nr:OmpH family outer membrane protein [Bacteroidaceae bacterium]
MINDFAVWLKTFIFAVTIFLETPLNLKDEMKKMIMVAALGMCGLFNLSAQDVQTVAQSDSTTAVAIQEAPDTVSMMKLVPAIPVVSTPKTAATVENYQVGMVKYNVLLKEMTEYKAAMQQLSDLRAKYEVEANYNETAFKRQFAEYLQGQKEFPQSIMLKRQRDLQEEMEKCLAFRRDAEAQLLQAEQELLVSVKARLNHAIAVIGEKLQLDYVMNADNDALPYVSAKKVVDVTLLVQQQLLATPVTE